MPLVPITEAEELPTTFPARQPHQNILMVTPDTYRVGEHINPHMHGQVNSDAVRHEWEGLYQLYAQERPVETINPLEYYDADPSLRPPDELPDIVFAANQSLTYGEEQTAILSNMATDQRRREEEYFERFFDARGWTTHRLPDDVRFEGAGDAIWHPNRKLVWGGYGIRTDRNAYEHIAELLDVTVYTIPLDNELYYHLDTCYMPLDEDTVLIAEDAFDEEVRAAIDDLWGRVIVAPEDEANALACNVHAVTQSLVFMGDGAPRTRDRLVDAGFDVRVVTLSEFHKAGGSVFCLRQTF